MHVWLLHSSYSKLSCFSDRKSPLSIDSDTRNKGHCIDYFCHCIQNVKHQPTRCYYCITCLKKKYNISHNNISHLRPQGVAGGQKTCVII